MKIKEIKQQDGNVFIITLKPNFIERLFGFTQKEIRIKNTYDTYYYGGGFVYIREDGHKLGNDNWIGRALDNYQRRF